jgi:hypothetical protein
VSANNLKAEQQALSDLKFVRLRAHNSLAEERATRQAAEQSCQQFKDANATLVLELDFQVICTDEVVLRLKNAESRLEATEEDLKNQKQLLESAWKTLSKREDSFNMVISSVVAHAAALFMNHLSDLNMELLCQDFTVDDVEGETLVSSAFDAAQDFISSYDFSSLAKSDDNDSPKAL